MSAPVHFDLLRIEEAAREAVAKGCDQVREERRRQGKKDSGLTDLQQSLMEINITASVRLAKAMNDGFQSSEIAQILGSVIGNLMNHFRMNFDPEGKVAPLLFDSLDEAIKALMTNDVGDKGLITRARTPGQVGGSA